MEEYVAARDLVIDGKTINKGQPLGRLETIIGAKRFLEAVAKGLAVPLASVTSDPGEAGG